jgi:hypothetical protein
VANDGLQQDTEQASGSGFKLALLSRKETKELLLRKEDRDYGVQSADRLCTNFPRTGSDDEKIENESQAGEEQGEEELGLGVQEPGTEELGVDDPEGKKVEDSEHEN